MLQHNQVFTGKFDAVEYLANLQVEFYSNRFKQYPGHWSLRRDLTWVPEKLIVGDNLYFNCEPPNYGDPIYIVDGRPGMEYESQKMLIHFGLITLKNWLDNDSLFAHIALNWINRNGLLV